MYKVASDKKQRALHHGVPTDWVNGTETQSLEDQLENMRRADRSLVERIKLATGAERKTLVDERARLCGRISQFKDKASIKKIVRDGYEHTFVKVARSILPAYQYNALRDAAMLEYDRLKKATEPGIAEWPPGAVPPSEVGR